MTKDRYGFIKSIGLECEKPLSETQGYTPSLISPKANLKNFHSNGLDKVGEVIKTTSLQMLQLIAALNIESVQGLVLCFLD